MSTRSIREIFAPGITLTLLLAARFPHATPPQSPIYWHDETMHGDGTDVFAWAALLCEFGIAGWITYAMLFGYK